MIKSMQLAYNDSFDLSCKLTAEAGFKHVSVNLTEVLDKTEDEWKRVTEDIQRILDKYSLKCNQTHPYYYDLFVSSEILEERYEYAIKRSIIASAELGASWCAIHPRSASSKNFSHHQAYEDNRKFLSEYLEIAKKYGTGIAVENMPIYTLIVPVVPFYCSHPDDLCKLADSFKDDSMGICWDFGHANLISIEQDKVVKELGERIKITHVHSNCKRDDEHLPPDQGNVPWNKIMPVLGEMGYEGSLTLETHCRHDDVELLASFLKHNYQGLKFLERLSKKEIKK